MRKILIVIVLCLFSFFSEALSQTSTIVVLKKNSGHNYKKLQVIAAQKNIRLKTMRSIYDFRNFAKTEKINAIIYQQGSEHTQPPDTGYLQVIFDNVRKGASAVCLPEAERTDTDTMLDLFGASTVKERVLKPAPTHGEVYWHELEDLRIGIVGKSSIMQHFLPANPAWQVLGRVKDKNNRERCLAMSRALDQGKIMFLVPIMLDHGSHWAANPFFSDNNIDDFDNKTAAKRLMEWLLKTND